MPRRETSDAVALLITSLRDAGWLFDVEVQDTPWGPRIFLGGMKTETATELALTIQAGLEARVIRS